MDELQTLADLARLYYDRQWMFATAGNLSVRAPGGETFWITASGKHKGKVSAQDFVEVSVRSGETVTAIPPNKASAETTIHRSIYSLIPEAKACLHVHTVSSNLLGFNTPNNPGYKKVPIPPIEIIKAFGIWDEKPKLEMPVFYNFSSVPKISETILEFGKTNPLSPLPFLLVEEHGPTVWGRDLEEANRHLEAVVFLFDVMARSL